MIIYTIMLSNETSLSNDSIKSSGPPQAEIWGFGIIAITVLSSCSAIAILILQCISKRVSEKIPLFFIGLGIGSISGAVLFHLLPETFENDGAWETSETSISALVLSWLIAGGIYMFCLGESFAKVFGHFRKLRRVGNLAEDKTTDGYGSIIDPQSEKSINDSEKSTSSIKSDAEKSVIDAKLKQPDTEGEHGHCLYHAASCSDDHIKLKVKAVAYMITCGDGLHKFVDGLTIGSVFAVNISTGVSIALAIVCEEFPHELGDVAILRDSGMSYRQVFLYNMLSASFCYAGFVVGVFAGGQPAAQKGILALASGMFLFVALSTMLPRVKENVEKRLTENDVRKAIFELCLQVIGIATGLTILFLIAYYKESIRL